MSSVSKERERLLELMANVDPASDVYDKLSTQLEKLTKSEQNDKGWKTQIGMGLLQSAISSVSSFATVYSVLRHEDKGNILTTKSLNYAEKPRMVNLNYDKTPDTRREKAKYLGTLVLNEDERRKK